MYEIYLIFVEITKLLITGGVIFFIILPYIDSGLENFFSKKYLPATLSIAAITFLMWLKFG